MLLVKETSASEVEKSVSEYINNGAYVEKDSGDACRRAGVPVRVVVLIHKNTRYRFYINNRTNLGTVKTQPMKSGKRRNGKLKK